MERVDPCEVLCPPCDMGTHESGTGSCQEKSYNASLLEMGVSAGGNTRTSNPYARSRDLFYQWRDQGILLQEAVPALYYLEQSFVFDSRPITRGGIIAAVQMDERDQRNIFACSRPDGKSKTDRLRQIKAVAANTGSIFGIYSDPSQTVKTQIRTRLKVPEWDTGSERMWVIRDKGMIRNISTMMKDKKILMARGRHGYEIARLYRDQMRIATGAGDGQQAFDYVMMFLCNMDEEGLVSSPMHRVISDSAGIGLVDLEYRLKEYFNMIPCAERKGFLSCLGRGGSGHIGLYVRDINRYYLLEPLDTAGRYPAEHKRQAVEILHAHIIEPLWGSGVYDNIPHISYKTSAYEALDMIDNSQADIVFLLNPSSIKEIMELAADGFSLPPNALAIYPWIPCGAVFCALDP